MCGELDPRYSVQIQPRGEKPTKIPSHLLSTLKTNYMFAIRVKITQLPKSRHDDVMKVSGTAEENDDVQIVREEKRPHAAAAATTAARPTPVIVTVNLK